MSGPGFSPSPSPTSGLGQNITRPIPTQAQAQAWPAQHYQGMGDSMFGESSRNCTLSWIWKVQGVATAGTEGEAVLLEALRVEWCRLRAHANQWVEEVELLLEEMQRVSAFLAWHAVWWDEQAAQRVGLDDASLEGIRGYAKRQAALCRSMRDVFLTKWSIVPALFHPKATTAPV
ncbi:hypothetical protein EDB19DRAFT_1834899 [Suillus lakei]|nr:hypothetical protein EDB19DRAFT_1834899 [Suillus lakei]